MLKKRYDTFRREAKKRISGFKKGLTRAQFDAFIGEMLSVTEPADDDSVYCRDGFAHVIPIDRHTYQLVCFQINSFGRGIFGEGVKKLCTPILLTVKVHGSHAYLNHRLKDACISIEDFYLGRRFCGSKGALCDRDKFDSLARMIFLSKPDIYSYNHHIVYQLINSNYLCHHIAEVMGYAFGALDVHWTLGEKTLYLSSGSRFNEAKDKLLIDVIDSFSSERMSGLFVVPHYAKLSQDIRKFKEEFDTLTWEVRYRGELETFYLPIGYQKVRKQMFHKNVNVITSQHIIEQVLTEYYGRKNAFVVANTFQTLEYLSRAFLAKKEGRSAECNDFVRTVSSCLGHYPEKDFEKLYKEKESRYGRFISEYSHTVFFRPPVLT